MYEWWRIVTENGAEYINIGIRVILIIVASQLLIFLLSRVIARSFKLHARKSKDEHAVKRANTSVTLLQSLLKYVVYFIAVAIILGEVGLGSTMTSLLATAGIGGLALGIGAQSLIKDVVAGLFILFENQYTVGDQVKIGEISGIVETIAVRITTIRGWRGELNIIPNGSITSVINYSRGGYLALIEIPLDYENDIERVKAIISEEAQAYRAANPEYTGDVSIQGVDKLDGRITIMFTIGTNEKKYSKVERDMRQRIKTRFDKEGITMPAGRIHVFERKDG